MSHLVLRGFVFVFTIKEAASGFKGETADLGDGTSCQLDLQRFAQVHVEGKVWSC